MIYLLKAILFTIAVEVAVIVPWFWNKWWQAFIYVALINLLTVPLVNLAYIAYPNLGLWETAAMIAEAILLWRLLRITWWQGLLLSVVANLASLLVGSMIF